jgi:hypothetical protein
MIAFNDPPVPDQRLYFSFQRRDESYFHAQLRGHSHFGRVSHISMRAKPLDRP